MPAKGDGDIWPRKNKAGLITSYRGAYFGPDGKRRYVSGKTKEATRAKLRKARGDADRGFVSDGRSTGTLLQPRLARISPRPVTSDSRPVSPCSEPPTKEQT
jgi:hypothetical protein